MRMAALSLSASSASPLSYPETVLTTATCPLSGVSRCIQWYGSLCTPVRRYLTVPAMVSCAGDPAKAGVVPPCPALTAHTPIYRIGPRSLVVLMQGGRVGMMERAKTGHEANDDEASC